MGEILPEPSRGKQKPSQQRKERVRREKRGEDTGQMPQEPSTTTSPGLKMQGDQGKTDAPVRVRGHRKHKCWCSLVTGTLGGDANRKSSAPTWGSSHTHSVKIET